VPAIGRAETSRKATMSNHLFAPVISTVTVTPAFGPGGTVFTANVVASGRPNVRLSYQWRLDGVDIPGATRASLMASDSGQLTVVVTAQNNQGADTRESEPVHVCRSCGLPEILEVAISPADGRVDDMLARRVWLAYLRMTALPAVNGHDGVCRGQVRIVPRRDDEDDALRLALDPAVEAVGALGNRGRQRLRGDGGRVGSAPFHAAELAAVADGAAHLPGELLHEAVPGVGEGRNAGHDPGDALVEGAERPTASAWPSPASRRCRGLRGQGEARGIDPPVDGRDTLDRRHRAHSTDARGGGAAFLARGVRAFQPPC
jgi:hypothetical protein